MPPLSVLENTLECAHALDREDPLHDFRDSFCIPPAKNGAPSIYFCGNSLGCMPVNARELVAAELKKWELHGVEGHFTGQHPWVSYHELFAGPLARLAGAKPLEVVAMNSLTVNLHLLMSTFYLPQGDRNLILMEADAFPSDHYAIDSHAALRGLDPSAVVVKIKPRPGAFLLETSDVLDTIAALGSRLALVMLGGVNYYTGLAMDIPLITAAGKAVGARVGWDLAHAIGNIPLRLHDWGVDFAVWCSYKYLNGGPGAVAGCFIHELHASRTDMPRLAGWWGHDKDSRFRMESVFSAIPTAEGWQMSNPPILALAPLRASLALFDAAGMIALRKKAVLMAAFARVVLAPLEAEGAFQIITPASPEASGCQLSLLTGAEGKSLFQYLEARGVICDWRAPNVIRLAPAPLYNRFEEIWRFGQLMWDAWKACKP